MLILPYIHEIVKQNNLDIHTIKLLTVGGKNIWEESEKLDIDNDILNPNDIYRKGEIIKIKKHLQLCEVDVDKTQINDFYKWDEISINDSDTFCWRSIYYFLDTNKDSWLNIPDNEKIGNYKLDEIIKTILINSYSSHGV